MFIHVQIADSWHASTPEGIEISTLCGLDTNATGVVDKFGMVPTTTDYGGTVYLAGYSLPKDNTATITSWLQETFGMSVHVEVAVIGAVPGNQRVVLRISDPEISDKTIYTISWIKRNWEAEWFHLRESDIAGVKFP